jgi:hypothetical protein
LPFGNAELFVRASAETTGGAFRIVEEIDPLDTPRHVHWDEDELFSTSSEHVFTVGDSVFGVRPGASVFAPRDVPYEHRRVRTGT